MSAGKHPAHHVDERDGFRFRGGRRALDLTATLQGRLKEVGRELLGTPEDLARWLVAADMARTAVATEEDLRAATILREAIYALVDPARAGPARVGAARSELNEIAAGAAAVPVLRDDGGVALVGDAGMLLVTLAREAVDLLGGSDASRIRQCQSPTCTIPFVDDSRKGDRRWCSMRACGNRAKVAEHRKRSRLLAGQR